jgi:hypothetical protein
MKTIFFNIQFSVPAWVLKKKYDWKTLKHGYCVGVIHSNLWRYIEGGGKSKPAWQVISVYGLPRVPKVAQYRD